MGRITENGNSRPELVLVFLMTLKDTHTRRKEAKLTECI